jgi:DNA-binding GntR family transcriptional regulator
VEETRPPQNVADALDLGPQDTAVVRRRLVLLDGRPTELADLGFDRTAQRNE